MTWGWDRLVAQLQAGQSVTFTPRGHSMEPRVHHGQTVTVVPVTEPLAVGDVVFVRLGGRLLLHLVHAINGDRVQIANNRGKINGWAHRRNVYGKALV